MIVVKVQIEIKNGLLVFETFKTSNKTTTDDERKASEIVVRSIRIGCEALAEIDLPSLRHTGQIQ